MPIIKRDKLGRFIKGYYTGGSTGKHWKLPSPTKEHKRKNSETHKGKHYSPETEFKKGYDVTKHWNWKGGITPINYLIRQSKKYKEWQQSVYKKDNWTCQICKKHCHTDIVAHHLFSFELFPNKRFQVKNGITLCRKCHINLHKIIKELHRLIEISCQ